MQEKGGKNARTGWNLGKWTKENPAYDAGVIDEKALDNIQHKEQT